jgi:hypothetical protein
MSSLEMFLDEPVFVWTDAHVEGLHKLWAKYGERAHSLYAYNKQFHMNLLRDKSSSQLRYIVDQKVKAYSDWAAMVLEERKTN